MLKPLQLSRNQLKNSTLKAISKPEEQELWDLRIPFSKRLKCQRERCLHKNIPWIQLSILTRRIQVESSRKIWILKIRNCRRRPIRCLIDSDWELSLQGRHPITTWMKSIAWLRKENRLGKDSFRITEAKAPLSLRGSAQLLNLRPGLSSWEKNLKFQRAFCRRPLQSKKAKITCVIQEKLPLKMFKHVKKSMQMESQMWVAKSLWTMCLRMSQLWKDLTLSKTPKAVAGFTCNNDPILECIQIRTIKADLVVILEKKTW